MTKPEECRRHINNLANTLERLIEVNLQQLNEDQIDETQLESQLRKFDTEFTHSWSEMLQIVCDHIGPPVAVDDVIDRHLSHEHQYIGFLVEAPIGNPMVKLTVKYKLTGDVVLISQYRTPSKPGSDDPDFHLWQPFMEKGTPVDEYEINKARQAALSEIPSDCS